MSIATQLTALAANRDAIKAAIEAKGVADAGDTLAEFPAAIASIPSGGGDEWTPPSEWPNLREIIAADTEEYEYKIYMLFDTAVYPSVPNVMNIVRGAAKAVTSDGTIYTANANHTWDASDTYGRYRWIAWYSATGFTQIQYNHPSGNSGYDVLWIVGNKAFVGNDTWRFNYKGEHQRHLESVEMPSITINDTSANYSAVGMFFYNYSLSKIPDSIDISVAKNTSSMFAGCALLKSVPTVLDTSSSTNFQGMFQGCGSLRSVPDILDTSNGTNFQYMFASCGLLERVPSVLDLSEATTTISMFSGCYSLKAVPNVLNLSSVENTNSMFANCVNLSAVPSVLDLSSATNVAYMFQYCYNLLAVPDVIDLSSVTSASNQNSIFSSCNSLQRLPTHVTSNWSLQFTNCGNIRDKDSVATFTNGAVTGGFVGNLNTCPNSGQTITLNSYIKGLFTAEEQAAIETAMSNKNWTLSW